MDAMKKRLETMKEKLTEAYMLTGNLQEKGEALDALAMARQDLRDAFRVAKDWLAELEKEEDTHA